MIVRAAVEDVDVQVLEVPTEHQPESDGTLEWRSTTVVVVEARAAGETGLGITYAAPAAGAIVRDKLAGVVCGHDAMAVTAAQRAMDRAVRNLGRSGECACAISAVDIALWDLKARLLGVPLAALLGPMRDSVPIYGSGGFTSLTRDQLIEQMVHWVDRGVPRVKMKVGRRPGDDPERVAAVRAAVGPAVDLMVDANGAYSRKQALALADAFARSGVVWFEEPVSSDDREGLRLVRDRAPAGMNVAAGEYGFTPDDVRLLLAAGAVDVLQADATRCMGITGFLAADALCQAHHLPLSAHCAPAIHLHVAAAARSLIHIESFRDHERIEQMIFDGLPESRGGQLFWDPSRPGHGLALRRSEARRLAA